jgi:glutaredoxin
VEGGGAKVAKALASESSYPEPVFHAPQIANVFSGPSTPAPEYRVYTKPGCPHCERAKELLISKAIAFETVDLVEAAHRRAKFAEIETTWGEVGWNTSPMIFQLGAAGAETAFIGGADELASELAE